MSEYEQKLEQHKALLTDGSFHQARPMNPKEEKFVKLFFGTVERVKDMTDLELRAHREEIADIAFEARATLTAIDSVEKERQKARKPKGFIANVNDDDINSNAINTIKDREKKLSKKDKQVQNLMNLLMISQEDAEKMLTASAVLTITGKTASGTKIAETKPAVIKNPFEKPALTKVTDFKCYECNYQFSEKLSGIQSCPECKTELELVKPLKHCSIHNQYDDSCHDCYELQYGKKKESIKPSFTNPFDKKG